MQTILFFSVDESFSSPLKNAEEAQTFLPSAEIKATSSCPQHTSNGRYLLMWFFLLDSTANLLITVRLYIFYRTESLISIPNPRSDSSFPSRFLSDPCPCLCFLGSSGISASYLSGIGQPFRPLPSVRTSRITTRTKVFVQKPQSKACSIMPVFKSR